MSETTTALIGQSNIEAILADYKKNLPKTKIMDLRTSATSTIFGKELGGTISKIAYYGSGAFLTEGLIDAIFGKKDAWVNIKVEDKKNLIDGLTIEAIYDKHIQNFEAIKTYIYVRLKDNKILEDTTQEKFYSGDGTWTYANINKHLKEYADLLFLLNAIASFTATSVLLYESSKLQVIALTAILNTKNGKVPTTEETEAIQNYLQLLQGIEISKGVRKTAEGTAQSVIVSRGVRN